MHKFHLYIYFLKKLKFQYSCQSLNVVPNVVHDTALNAEMAFHR